MQRRLRDERGVSLVEVLVAVSLLGLAFTAIVGGMVTSVIGSDVQRKQAVADTAVRSYAQAVKAADYVACAGANDYAPGAVGYDVPEGLVASVSSVKYWQASGSDPNTGAFASSCGTDEGLQLLQITVAAQDGRATEAREIVKRRP